MNRRKIAGIGISLLLSISLMGCGNGNQIANKNDASSQPTAATTTDNTNPVNISTNETTKTSQQGKLKIYYLDVWQGDSILVQTPKGDNILIDGGNNQMGTTVVRDLNNLQINKLTAIIATHPDADHIGGLDTVLRDVKVDNVYTPKITSTTKSYQDFIKGVKNQGLKLKEAKSGVSMGLQEVDAHFVSPVKPYGKETNEWSAVLRLTYGKNSFLFTGDAPVVSEHDMISSGEDLHADVLKVGHHGSKGSTSQAFLDAVKPKYAVISVGKGNDYGHPTEEVLKRLQQNHIETFRTDEDGTIEATSDGNKITFEDAKTNSVIATTLNRLTMPTSGATGGNHLTSTTHVAKSSKSVPTPILKQHEQVSVSTPYSTPSPSVAGFQAAIDDSSPHDYETIHLSVTGVNGTPFTAVFHYKSKDTTYTGTTGSSIPVRISRATPGFTVNVDVSIQVNGKTYTTQTSFTPQ